MALVALVGGGILGCGADSYDQPESEQVLTVTDSPLIDAATLKGWMEQGLVNAGVDSENVVILHVEPNDKATPAATANYNAGHVPGAYIWNGSTELTQSRLDGLSVAGSELPTGAMIDQVLARAGVNKNSTIVLSYPPQAAMHYPSRAYFTLRYWGFPKSKIKVLNGGSVGWTAGGYDLTTVAPAPVWNNSFSVRDNVNLRNDLRYSLGEMIQEVDANNAAIDASGNPWVNIIQQTEGPRTIANAIGRSMSYFFNAYDATAGTGGTFKTAAEVEAALADTDGPNNDKTLGAFVPGIPTITHCVSGMSCTPIFFALDAILGAEVAIYDGSTSQWDAYKAKDATVTAGVVPNDAWRTDLYNRTNPAILTSSPTTTTNVIDPVLNSLYLSVDDPRANQLENEDLEYMTPSTSGPPTSTGTGDSSGC
ncbi:MAG: selenite/tellurite reduction operon rhodanese-like protein ExtH [Desulfuromonadales bacterium]